MSAEVFDIRDYERKPRQVRLGPCLHADDYKAIFPPHCNGGNPCRACTKKWEEAQTARRSV